MTGDDSVLRVNQDGIGEAESSNALGNLAELLF
jgi:hypothetical protein